MTCLVLWLLVGLCVLSRYINSDQLCYSGILKDSYLGKLVGCSGFPGVLVLEICIFKNVLFFDHQYPFV